MTIQLDEATAKNEITILTEQILSEAEQINAVIIFDDKGYADAGDMLKSIKVRIKMLEDKRKAMVEIPNKYVKWVNEMFRPLTDQGEVIKKILETKMLDYSAEVRRKAEAAERARREAEQAALKAEQEAKEKLALKFNSETMINDAIKVEEKRAELAVEPITVKHTVKTEASMSYVIKKWTGEIENEALIPREYLSVDMVKVNAAIKSGVRSIPGVKIYEKEAIGSR